MFQCRQCRCGCCCCSLGFTFLIIYPWCNPALLFSTDIMQTITCMLLYKFNAKSQLYVTLMWQLIWSNMIFLGAFVVFISYSYRWLRVYYLTSKVMRWLLQLIIQAFACLLFWRSQLYAPYNWATCPSLSSLIMIHFFLSVAIVPWLTVIFLDLNFSISKEIPIREACC